MIKKQDGKLQFNNGNKYEGDFKNDKPDGKGTHHYNNGERYEGAWSNGECNGNGVYFFNNGDRTEGKFTKHKASGVHNRNLTDGRQQKITY